MLDITAKRLAHLFYIWIPAEDPRSWLRFSIVSQSLLENAPIVLQARSITVDYVQHWEFVLAVLIFHISVLHTALTWNHLHLLNLWACPNNEDLWHTTKVHGWSFTQEQVVINYYIHLYMSINKNLRQFHLLHVFAYKNCVLAHWEHLY
jgi:hypothetical protein